MGGKVSLVSLLASVVLPIAKSHVDPVVQCPVIVAAYILVFNSNEPLSIENVFLLRRI